MEIVQLLLDNQVHTNATGGNGNTALAIAATMGNDELVSLLLTYSVDDVNVFNDDGGTPLYLAAKNRHFDIARSLLAAGAHIDPKNPDLLLTTTAAPVPVSATLVRCL